MEYAKHKPQPVKEKQAASAEHEVHQHVSSQHVRHTHVEIEKTAAVVEGGKQTGLSKQIDASKMVPKGDGGQVTVRLALSDAQAAKLDIPAHPGIQMQHDFASGVVVLKGEAAAIRELLSALELIPEEDYRKGFDLTISTDGSAYKAKFAVLYDSHSNKYVVPADQPSNGSSWFVVPEARIQESGFAGSRATLTKESSLTYTPVANSLAAATVFEAAVISSASPAPTNLLETLTVQTENTAPTAPAETPAPAPVEPESAAAPAPAYSPPELFGFAPTNGGNQVPVHTIPGTIISGPNMPVVFAGGTAISITDADNELLTVTLSGNHGVVTLNGTVGLTMIEGDGTADAQVIFRGLPADINAALNGLTFTPEPAYMGNAGIHIITNDGTAIVHGNADISISNNPPVNAVPGAQNTVESTPLTLSTGNGNVLSVSDADGDALTVTLTATNGTLTLAGIAGLVFNNGDGTADATMEFSGNAGAINAALDGMIFTPTPAFQGAAQIQIQTSDGQVNDTDTVAITINANVPPSFTSTPITDGVSGAAYSYTITTSNPDGGNASIASIVKPAWLNFTDNGDGTATLSGTPAAGNRGLHNITIRADDGLATTDQIFQVFIGDGAYSGTPGSDTITGSGGTDYVSGAAGDDSLSGGGGDSDRVFGGDGNDTVDGGTGYYDSIYGGNGNDYLTDSGSDGYESFDGGTGNDTINGGLSGGNETMTGGTGNDVFLFTGIMYTRLPTGPTRITDFTPGDDIINVSAIGYTGIAAAGMAVDGQLEFTYNVGMGRTEIYDPFRAGFTLYLSGNIALTAGDFVFGTQSGTAGDNAVSGNGILVLGFDGNDTVTGIGGNAGILDGGNGNDVVTGSGAYSELLLGGNGNDTVDSAFGYGEALYGGSGDDILRASGGGGYRLMDGGADNDTLYGSNGQVDVLTGGTGVDRFIYSSIYDTTNAGADRITDFSKGSELIDISGTGYTGIAAAGMATEGQLEFVYTVGTNTTEIYDPYHTVFRIYLTGNIALDATDFIFGAQAADGLDNNLSAPGGRLLLGLGGNDTLTGTGGSGNIIDGGDGNDIITASGWYVDILYGGNGNDTVDSNDGYGDIIYGGAGDDLIFASNNGNYQALYGGADNDTLRASAGVLETFTGGTGADIFRFLNVAHSNGGTADRITDFENGTDIIDLTGLGFASLADFETLSFAGGTTTLADAGTNFRILFTGDVTALLDNTDFIF